ncbi:hypothetical protein BBO99_00008410 [Phytophthora kernoviae]|uniref:Uncharacterized protein n=1 Tax=Phytophthora kernoviae TaxID=325452 RepID=A0A3R7IGI8_9STRA|nr:hypothetical protein JM16_008695 [Phytophthora kernoviae]RLN10450.1 hypothetical protein BBI17_008346 [Phytophthora kernoviae]RLN75315.1 hypothetical protein BBO99_00008410 [Phytophthora kernoviae]
MSMPSFKSSATAGGTSSPAGKHSTDESSLAGKRIYMHDYHAWQHKKRSGRTDAPENTDSHDEVLDSASSEPKVVTTLGGEDKTESSMTPRAVIRPGGSPWMRSSQRIHEMGWPHDGCSAASYGLFNDDPIKSDGVEDLGFAAESDARRDFFASLYLKQCFYKGAQHRFKSQISETAALAQG